jgi:RNA polymerase sigma-70 factor (ECF subfamily)
MTDGHPGSDEEAPEDRALLEAHLAGDPEAFGRLFARHRDRLWAVALRTAGNREDAADALQDALVSAFRRADSFRGDAAVTTWLHRIVVNACLDRLRRRQVRAAEPLPDDLDERRRQVLAALDQLPPDQKAALVLVDMEGYSVAEAAAILDAPTGTVKSRCARGRARLAVLLADLLAERRGTGRSSPASHRGPPDGSAPDPGLPAPRATPRATPGATPGGGEQA